MSTCTIEIDLYDCIDCHKDFPETEGINSGGGRMVCPECFKKNGWIVCRGCEVGTPVYDQDDSGRYCLSCATVLTDEEKQDHWFEDNAICIHHDIPRVFLPEWFAKNSDMEHWHINEADADILRDGPGHENYWDTWEYVLNNAFSVKDGKTYRLIQHSNLFAVPDMPTPARNP